MIVTIINSALSLALFVAFFWALDKLGDLRRGQTQLQEDIDRIVEALGVPSRRERAGVRCEQCGTIYLASLPECYRCGRPRPANAVRIVPGQSAQGNPSASKLERGG
jgi:ribosomal protein S14